MVKNLLKLLIFIAFLGGIALAYVGLLQEDHKPTLQTGAWFVGIATAAAIVLGLGIGIVGGSLGRAEMERDLSKTADIPAYLHIYGLVAELMLNVPAVYYLVLCALSTGAFGGAAWGMLTYWERDTGTQAIGTVECRVVSAKGVPKMTTVDVRLRCPLLTDAQRKPPRQAGGVAASINGGGNAGRSTLLTLRISRPPVKWPDTMTVPVSRGRLGTVFLDGSQL